MTQQKPPNLKTLPITGLIEDYRLYPRAEVDGSTVKQFREALRAGASRPSASALLPHHQRVPPQDGLSPHY
jgi:hypothetical protein